MISDPFSGWRLCLIIGLTISVVFATNQEDSHRPEDDSKNILRRSDLVEDAAHVRKHLEESAKLDPSDVTERELEFHYFKGHDTNDDNLLDGLELFAALWHNMEMQLNAISFRSEVQRRQTFEMYMNNVVGSIDEVLAQDDTDDDGYLSYAEFKISREAARIMQTKPTP